VKESWLDKHVWTEFVGKPIRRRIRPGKVVPARPKSFRQFYMTVMRRRFPRQRVCYPYHLQEMIDAILTKRGAREVVAVPRRHSKTTTILACLAYICLTEFDTKSSYSSYSDSLVNHAGREFDQMIKAWGGSAKNGTANEKNINGNTVYFISINGGQTGKGANRCIVVDDPVKNWEVGKSVVELDKLFENLESAILSGAENEDVNEILCGTRWSIYDPQGRMLEQGWHLIHYKAIRKENGVEVALWEEVRTLSFLQRMRAERGPNSIAWISLMQGEPPGDKFRIFSSTVKRHSQLPLDWRDFIVRSAAGIDLAYSANRGSDSKAIGVTHKLSTGQIVIDHGELSQASSNEFLTDQKPRMPLNKHKKATCYWYASAAEADRAFEIDRVYGISCVCVGSAGKLGNAQNLAREWNAGNVYVPDSWQMHDPILKQILGFTGSESNHDDSVDAFSVAVDEVTDRWRGGPATKVDRFLGIKIKELSLTGSHGGI
jgi:hypothetical protein